MNTSAPRFIVADSYRANRMVVAEISMEGRRGATRKVIARVHRARCTGPRAPEGGAPHTHDAFSVRRLLVVLSRLHDLRAGDARARSGRVPSQGARGQRSRGGAVEHRLDHAGA